MTCVGAVAAGGLVLTAGVRTTPASYGQLGFTCWTKGMEGVKGRRLLDLCRITDL